MNAKISWVRTLRAILVATVLLMALLGAVLGAIGTHTPFSGPVWMWASDPGTHPGTRGKTLPHDRVPPAPG